MRRSIPSFVAALTTALVVAGAALAAVPDGSGVIHGCFSPNGAKAKGGTALYLVDSASTTCSNGQAPLNWNQTGPQGPQGIQGPQGNQGPQGIQGPAGPAGTTSAGYATTSGFNPITLPSGGGNVLVASLTVPDGTYIFNATVQVYNSNVAGETSISCNLRHGPVFGGSVLDIAETRLPVATTDGLGAAKLALAGAADTTGDVDGSVVDIICSSYNGAGAQYAQLTAIQVAPLAIQP
jgi:hypothetical protein